MRWETAIILAAGKGTRMGVEKPKVLIELCGKPTIAYAIDFWSPYVDNFIFVLGYKSEEVTKVINKYCEKDYQIVIQGEQSGIANAVLQTKSLVKGNFIVQLADCINIGSFEFPEKFELGYGVWKGNYQKQLSLCCSAWVVEGYVVRVVEKGRAPYVGIGTYFLDKRCFYYIQETKPSSYRNEVEITNVLQNMIDNGERIIPVYLEGEFINLTYPEDIKIAEDIICRQ